MSHSRPPRPSIFNILRRELRHSNEEMFAAGCGTGVLSIGCVMLGAGSVVGFDVDPEALETCRSNAEEFEVDNLELVKCDVSRLSEESMGLGKKFDTVVLNPPFGTKRNWGLDLAFVKSGEFKSTQSNFSNGINVNSCKLIFKALALSNNAVYSLHKTSTREHIVKKAHDWGVKATVLAQLRYDLKGGKYKHHKKDTLDIEVDMYQFVHAKK